jgi:hypothetical protein
MQIRQKIFFRPYVKKLRRFSCAPFGLVQPSFLFVFFQTQQANAAAAAAVRHYY